MSGDNPHDRVRAFLDAYPNDGSSNIDPENIYSYGADGVVHTLTWGDLDRLCRDAERLALILTASLDKLSVELPAAYDPQGTNAVAWWTGISDFRDAVSHDRVRSGQ